MKRTIILVACMAGISVSAVAQRKAIDYEVDRLLKCGCQCFDYQTNENMDILKQDLSYSVQKLYRHVNDTTPCAKIRVHRLTQRMLSHVKLGGYDTVFYYNLLYARDSSNKTNYYNSIVARIKSNTVQDRIKLPPSVTQFIASPEFYKATTWELPLLISYLDMFEEIDNLKKWGNTNTHRLTEHAKAKLLVSLVRLGDSATTQEYLAMIPADSSYWDWDTYINGLNYARTSPATERLINLLNNEEKMEYSRYSYSDVPETYYTTVRTVALEKLARIVDGFPLKRIGVPYKPNDHFSEASEQDFKMAKQWFKRNPNYKIIRESDYNY